MNLLKKYENFILANASQISSIESSLRTLTYVLPGRFADAEFASEAFKILDRKGYQSFAPTYDSSDSLMWENDVQLEKQKGGKYMKGKAPKHTYYDKNDPELNILPDNWIEIMDEDKEDEEDNEWKVKKDLIEKV
ncbi:22267_t:CDS:2 [Entrophospora sp. SA101]|nr:22267_t:CDS:2 [Entrophospora sp. SA101]